MPPLSTCCLVVGIYLCGEADISSGILMNRGMYGSIFKRMEIKPNKGICFDYSKLIIINLKLCFLYLNLFNKSNLDKSNVMKFKMYLPLSKKCSAFVFCFFVWIECFRLKKYWILFYFDIYTGCLIEMQDLIYKRHMLTYKYNKQN